MAYDLNDMNPDLKAAIEAECLEVTRRVGDELRKQADDMLKNMETWEDHPGSGKVRFCEKFYPRK